MKRTKEVNERELMKNVSWNKRRFVVFDCGLWFYSL